MLDGVESYVDKLANIIPPATRVEALEAREEYLYDVSLFVPKLNLFELEALALETAANADIAIGIVVLLL